MIEGHTDSKGRDSYNLNLSKNRAKAIYARILKYIRTEDIEISPERIRHDGFGEQRPIMVNGLEDQNASRRVVIRPVLNLN